MSDFSELIEVIEQAIKTNNNEEITGAILQGVLKDIVEALGDEAINALETALQNETNTRTLADTALGGRIDDEATARGNADTALSDRLGSTITAENTAADQIGAEAEAREAADTVLQGLIDGITDKIKNGYVYAGIATPSSTPATGKVFYLALTAGTYTNFGSTVVSQGINILKYNGSAWSLDAFIGIDDTPTPNSPNLVKSGGVAEELALGAVYDVSAKNPTAGPNNDGKWESLSALLSDANLNTLIPTAVRKGGMCIKFVRTSDNKYIQARLMSDEWSINTDDWAIEEEVVYVDNPEFVHVKTDSEEKILWAIKTDGTVYYGAGVPPQVIDYINGKITELGLGSVNDIVAFLNGLEEGGNTLQQLLNEKLDAEGLDSEALGSISIVENPEYMGVEVDSEDKILGGRKNDGTKFENLPVETPAVIIESVDNPEWIEVKTDNEDRILEGIKKDGSKYIARLINRPNKLDNVILVGKGNGYDYNDIQDAIDSITDDSITNRYLILVFPGTYSRISQIDNVNRVRYMSIIGIDKQACVITDNTGNYFTPCFEEKMDGSVENLSFIMKSDSEHYNPDSERNFAYALHSDYEGARKCIYRNCYFESNSGPAVGLGTHADVSLVFENCEFIRQPFNGQDLGAVFAHTGTGDASGQCYVFRDCIAVNNVSNTSYGLRFRFIEGTIEGNYTIIVQRCGSFNTENASAYCNATIDYMSFNNNVDILNANNIN